MAVATETDPGGVLFLDRDVFGPWPVETIEMNKTLGGVAVLSLSSDTPWWGRLLAEPKLKVFSSMQLRYKQIIIFSL